MRRQGEGWQGDLLLLLDEMQTLYDLGQGAAVMSRP
jgi:hypothetical protein